jgi:hypothetical protein
VNITLGRNPGIKARMRYQFSIFISDPGQPTKTKKTSASQEGFSNGRRQDADVARKHMTDSSDSSAQPARLKKPCSFVG